MRHAVAADPASVHPRGVECGCEIAIAIEHHDAAVASRTGDDVVDDLVGRLPDALVEKDGGVPIDECEMPNEK